MDLMISLKEIQSALKRQKEAAEKFSTLLKKRDELETLLLEQTDEETIQLLLNKRQEIDNHLDLLESDASLDQEKLLKEIRPLLTQDQNTHFENQLYKLSLLKQKLHEMQVKIAFHHQIFKHLDQIAYASQRMRRLSILSYMIGPNPTLMISNEMEALCKLIENKPINEPDYQAFLDRLKKNCEVRWSFSHLKTLKQHHEEALTIEKEFEKQLKSLQKDEIAHEEAFYAFIHSISQ